MAKVTYKMWFHSQINYRKKEAFFQSTRLQPLLDKATKRFGPGANCAPWCMVQILKITDKKGVEDVLCIKVGDYR